MTAAVDNLCHESSQCFAVTSSYMTHCTTRVSTASCPTDLLVYLMRAAQLNGASVASYSQQVIISMQKQSYLQQYSLSVSLQDKPC